MDTCDKCGKLAELYHNEASGLAYCEACDLDEPSLMSHLLHVELAEHNAREYAKDARRAEGHEGDVHRAKLVRAFLEPVAVLCDWMDNGWVSGRAA